MRNVQMLNFEIEINTPVEKVWHTMLDAESYKVWTLEFNPGGSWYEKENVGDFVEGEKIKFLGPGQDGKIGGMLAVAKKVEMYKEMYFEHFGMIMNGEEKTSGEEIENWAPSFEKYFFEKIDDNKTLLKVEMETSSEWASMMDEMWPKALAKLKEICEK
jgi:uncharacterized protein YndB with AHSA1/START domain